MQSITDMAAFQEQVSQLKQSQKLTNDLLNTLCPQAIEHYFVDGQIAVVNNVLAALSPYARRAVCKALKGFVPAQLDPVKGKFGKKEKNPKAVDRKRKAYLEFKATRQKFMRLVNDIKADEKKDAPYTAKAAKAVKSDIENGVKPADVLKASIDAMLEEGLTNAELITILGACLDTVSAQAA